jgi:subtilisin family serine protease
MTETISHRARRPWVVAGAAGLLVTAAGLAITSRAAGGPALAPLLAKPGSKTIADQYIVVLKRGTAAPAQAAIQTMSRALGGTVGFTYGAALQGFSVTATPAQLERLRALADVDYIEPDAVVSLDTVQTSPPNGLDRTSERYFQLSPLPPLDSRYTYSHNGTGVNVYVIDTGIRATHTDFGGRAAGAGFTAITDSFGTGDCQGHGTHVAGTIGGATYGIAKNVQLHSVRVLDCAGSGTLSGVLAGVNWVASNAVQPAVANMSLGGDASTALDAAVNAAISSGAHGITFAVAAGNATMDTGWLPVDACTQSPARVPAALTVGSVNPVNDNVSWFSNFGSCLDLWGPGEGIVSTWRTSDTATHSLDGTSQATPHVAGVAALWLQTHTAATPAAVRTAIMNAANDASFMPAWAGVIGLPPGSPNVELHWGSLNDGHDDGDPHINTVGGINYDFQAAGEFVLLRDGKTEIQTRQTAVETTTAPITNPYTGLTSCVSLNTAFAAKVNGHRVSFVPNVDGVPDPTGLQLRIDGALTSLGTFGANLGTGGHISNYGTGGIQVDFPDGTTAIVTPNWWPSESRWYLNVGVFHTPASEGIAGALAPGSWLPGLPGGGSMGPMPGSLHQRYLDLNTTYANAWRVTNATTLFDYAPGESTATFTFPSWPPEKAPCILGEGHGKPVEPLDRQTAQKLCSVVIDKDRNLSCVSDVMVTGEAGFAKAHQISEAIDVGSTRTLVDDPSPITEKGKPATFTISVDRNTTSNANPVPTGTVQLFVDGKEASGALKLDKSGQVAVTVQAIEPGVHDVTAAFTPTKGSAYLTSLSVPVSHAVR